MYDANNIFAKIVRKEIPAKIVYEDEAVLAFHDVSPAAPVHVLVIPKGEYVSFNDFTAQAGEASIAGFFAKIQHIAENELKLAADGYRLITNHGANASQTVPHFHVHIVGGAKLGGLLPGDVLNR
ncbi:MAG: histidine triad nucleotide-binding protein [Rickettsiales bacterium]|nr:histidine triad nucleotide-binding protein [Rickettsiales bacterium]